MRVSIIIVSLMICSAISGYAQDGRSFKQRVEKSTKTKAGYNNFLLESVHNSDKIYSDYENTVQKVWDGDLKEDLRNSSRKPLRELAQVQQLVKEIAIYKGGEDYQKTVINYLNAVERKISLLETLGILGANPDSKAEEYNSVSRAFTDLSNEAIDIRNAVRRAKRDYEKNFYIE